MDHILHQIFKIILNILKKHEENSENQSIRLYVKTMEDGITFKLKLDIILSF